MFGAPTRNDDAAIVEIINAVRAIEPKPVQPAAASPAQPAESFPATFRPIDPLSDALEATYKLPSPTA